ncbi:hypothetical protein GB931_17970 [Modestobacter sp. I12A-02628]|uniref:Uncharacterized protein n=1 Tax=Goekera deserti TaxID=2497753 RepID=A0A7K3W874_9ACTN|nr:hypothetical protein [Goekera deserti]MPQ99770.1 hypothetical protein [Goekera deserti]NDI49529.1 hypothetical protein [Goekera deserti]NEL52597.1 hypothetical protein [Goekera deserti]
MSKRSISVGILTAGLTVGLAASAMGPAMAQGNPVGGKGNLYFLSGAVNASGQAQATIAFGDAGDEVFYGDWYGNGSDLPMVRRGNVFYVPKEFDVYSTQNVFVYGDANDRVLIGDWNGDGKDSIAVKRGNQYFVKNDNTKSGKADSEFFYGDANDTVLVGNWDGVSNPVASSGVDNSVPLDGDFTDAAKPAFAADVLNAPPVYNNATPPALVSGDPGYDANKNGDFTEAGDRQPGTGVDNNKDGDFTDLAQVATIADVPPGQGGKGDTIMVQRGNQFFVKNSITTGVADYTFYFGDPSDEKNVLVGDWATPATAATATASAMLPQSGDGADQIAIRRGFTYYQSSELEAARAKKGNPTTTRSFAYGDAGDTVFVASLPSEAVDEFGKSLYQVTLKNGVATQDSASDLPALAAGNYYYDAAGAPLVVTPTPTQNLTAAPVVAKTKAGASITIAVNEYYTENKLAGGVPVYHATTGVLYVTSDAAATVAVGTPTPVFTKSGAPVTTNTKLNNTTLIVTGDGLGVRR